MDRVEWGSGVERGNFAAEQIDCATNWNASHTISRFEFLKPFINGSKTVQTCFKFYARNNEPRNLIKTTVQRFIFLRFVSDPHRNVTAAVIRVRLFGYTVGPK